MSPSSVRWESGVAALPRFRRRGFSLMEILIVLALVGIFAAAVLPPSLRASSRLRVRLAGREVVGVLRLTRIYAIRYAANAAVKFTTSASGEVSFAIYRDGDGDGVRNDDIESGTDPALTPERRLAHLGSAVVFGIPDAPAPRHPSTGRRLTSLEDPIRFNRSDLASFSPIGAATPGTLYISDQRTNLVAVRVANRTGKVKLVRYDYPSETWKEI